VLRKKLIVAASRGGFYGPETPASFLRHPESCLKGVFGFIGLIDVTFIHAEGAKAEIVQISVLEPVTAVAA
jgi:FMN-dependent NADH-azoreductase